MRLKTRGDSPMVRAAYATEEDLLVLLLLGAGAAGPTLPSCLGLMFRATGTAASAIWRANILGFVLRLSKTSCCCCLVLLSTLGACACCLS